MHKTYIEKKQQPFFCQSGDLWISNMLIYDGQP